MGLRDFRIGWRLLLRQPLHSLVEILGLAAGFSVCFILLGYVQYSFNYDSDVPQRERVFVIKHRLNFIPRPQWMEYTPFALRDVALHSGLPLQVSAWWPRTTTLQLKGREQELDVVAVDPVFEDIAGLRATQGDLHAALTQPDGLALTPQTASRVFGTTEALGRTITINGQPLQVRALLPARPSNTTMPFGALVGVDSALWPEQERHAALSNWMGIGGRIYVKTGAGVKPQALQQVLQGVIDKAPWQSVASPEMKDTLGERKMVDIGLGPLTQAYFDRSVANTMGTGPRGDMRVVLAIGAAGVLILLLAVVNYVNLATVRTVQRQREIAVRRVLGASTRQLLGQFMAEAMLLSLLAAALGVMLAWLLLPVASELLERQLTGVLTPLSIAVCLLTGLVVGAVAGLYPGWLARGVDMRETLAHRSGETRGGLWLRRVLTSLQIAVAMGMGAVALAVLWQARFAAGVSPGFDTRPLLVVEMDKGVNDPHIRAFRDAVARLPGVAGVADSRAIPGRDDKTGTRGSEELRSLDGRSVPMPVQSVSPEFFKIYGLSPLAGRLFDPAIDRAQQNGEQMVVINQSAARALGWQSPQQAVGQHINQAPLRVIGIAPDLSWGSLRDPPGPMLYDLANDSRLLTVRIDAHAPADLEQQIAATWSHYFPAREPVVRRAASYYAEAYEDDVRMARLLGCATAVVLVMAAFGIYVLAAHSVQRRAREIVLRKLHGAGRSAIAVLVGREFLLLTAIAAIVALPPAWLSIMRYLAPFTQRAATSELAPLAALMFTLLIVAAAAGRHTWAAMRMAPVQALRE